MTMPFRLIASSLVFSAFLSGGVWFLCANGAFHCQVGTNVLFSEALIPVLIVIGLMFLVGIVVSFLSELVITFENNTRRATRLLIWVIGGAIVGVLPRLIWKLATGSFPTSLYPHIEYLPFIAGGVACTLLCGSLRENNNPFIRQTKRTTREQ